MSFLLEALGNGLLGELRSAFAHQLPIVAEDEYEDLEARVVLSPDSADLALRFGLVALDRLQYGEAKQWLQRALSKRENPQQAAIGLACLYDELNRPSEVLRHLESAQGHDPADPAVAFAIGACHERTGDLQAAAASYRTALQRCPSLRNARERLAAIALCEDDLDEATAVYATLEKLDPGLLPVLLCRAALELQNGRHEVAIERFQRALLIEPEATPAPVEEVDELVEEGRIEEALQMLIDVSDQYGGLPEFQVQLGDFYAKLHDDDNATACFERALELHPGFLEAAVKLGTQHLRNERFSDAAQLFNQATELNDLMITAFVGLGLGQHSVGRVEDATHSFNLAASLEPNSSLLFCESARLQLRSGRSRPELSLKFPELHDGPMLNEDLLFEELRRFRQAVLNNPNQAELHYRYGMLLRHVGELGDATRSFESAVAVYPSFSKAWLKLGICYFEQHEPNKALDAFGQGMLLKRADVAVNYELAVLFSQRSLFDLALEDFERQLEERGQRIAFRDNLALALQSVGMVDQASATWRLLCAVNDRSEADMQHVTPPDGNRPGDVGDLPELS